MMAVRSQSLIVFGLLAFCLGVPWLSGKPGGRAALGQAGAGAVDLERLAIVLPAGVPAKVGPVLEFIDQDGKAPPGFVGGRTFTNDGRDGEVILPRVDADGDPITYQEWDVNIKRPGVNRGPQRLVTGSDGSAYYSGDHYQTFVAIRGTLSTGQDQARLAASRGAGLPPIVVAAPAVGARTNSVLDHLRVYDRAMPGYAGGDGYHNGGQRVGQVLPRLDADFRAIHYREWDIAPRVPGLTRGPERLVTGSDGSAYYTGDHFQTFQRLR